MAKKPEKKELNIILESNKLACKIKNILSYAFDIHDDPNVCAKIIGETLVNVVSASACAVIDEEFKEDRKKFVIAIMNGALLLLDEIEKESKK